MERTDSAFFYTARHFGLNRVIISLVEHDQLDWNGRIAYIGAKAEQRRTEVYAMDLVWLIAKRYYTGLPQPSEVDDGNRKEDRRSAEQIKKDLLKKLGG